MRILTGITISVLLFLLLFAGANFLLAPEAAIGYWSDPVNIGKAVLLSTGWVVVVIGPAALITWYTKFRSKRIVWVTVSLFSLPLPLLTILTASAPIMEKMLLGTGSWLAGLASGAICILLGVLPLTRYSTPTFKSTG